MYHCSGFCCVALSLLPLLVVELSLLATRRTGSRTPGEGLQRCPSKLRMGLCIALATVLLSSARPPSRSWRLIVFALLFSPLLFANSSSLYLLIYFPLSLFLGWDAHLLPPLDTGAPASGPGVRRRRPPCFCGWRTACLRASRPP